MRRWLYCGVAIAFSLFSGCPSPVDKLPLNEWKKMRSPTSKNLYGVAVGAIYEGWAVGDSGVILHRLHEAFYFRCVPSSVATKLNAISFVQGFIWIVGDSGVIMGGDYSTLPLSCPVLEKLNDVKQHIGGNIFWVCGDKGTVLHYNGKEWQKLDPGVDFDLTDMCCLDSTDIWIVGKGGVLHFDGTQWSLDTLELGDSPSIYFTSPQDGWIATPMGSDGWVYHYDGERWEKVAVLKNTTPRDIAMHSPEEGFIVGTDIFQWDGSSWEKVKSGVNLYAIAVDTLNYGGVLNHRGALYYAVGANGVIYGYEEREEEK